MERTRERVDIDPDTKLSIDEIRKIPKGLYDFLCSRPDFAHQVIFPRLVKKHNLIEGTFLISKGVPNRRAFIGYGQKEEKGAEKFFFWPGHPDGDKVINLVITCGDSSFCHEERVSIDEKESILILDPT